MEIDLARDGVDLQGVSRRLRSQVCVVGGGIAGLVLTHRLAAAGITVTLLEAGGRLPAVAAEGDPFGAQLAGDVHRGTREGRVRALGGCSLTWGGQLLPLPDEAQWAVPTSELERWRPEAERMLGVDDTPYAAAAFFAQTHAALPAILAGLPEMTARLSKFVPFPKRNLAARLGAELLEDTRATVVMNAPMVGMVASAAGDRVACVIMQGAAGGRVRVEADHFVLAAGTVETCRLLLCSPTVANAQGQVGVGFQDHLSLAAATFSGAARARLVEELRPWITRRSGEGPMLHSLKLEPSGELREALAMPSAMAHLTIEEPGDSGIGLLRGLLRARQQGGFGAALRRTGLRLPKVLLEMAWLGASARLQRRRYVSGAAEVRLQLNVAQERSAETRIRLSGEVDAQGVPRAVVEWYIGDADLVHVRRFASYMRQRMREAGLEAGAEWQAGLFAEGPQQDMALRAVLDDARHAMGGACLGTDPRGSVVDPELRVHGTENLWVASAAVFPDGSAQLPTLTLATLAVRLADRLAREFA